MKLEGGLGLGYTDRFVGKRGEGVVKGGWELGWGGGRGVRVGWVSDLHLTWKTTREKGPAQRFHTFPRGF